MMKRAGLAALVTTFGILVGIAANAELFADGSDHRDDEGQGAFTFALIGDMPYGPEGDAKFPNVIADINADRQLLVRRPRRRFQERQLAVQRRGLLRPPGPVQRIRRPFVFVPGDNEWTDCHRANNGAYDPLERLAFLRASSFRPTRVSASAR